MAAPAELPHGSPEQQYQRACLASVLGMFADLTSRMALDPDEGRGTAAALRAECHRHGMEIPRWLAGWFPLETVDWDPGYDAAILAAGAAMEVAKGAEHEDNEIDLDVRRWRTKALNAAKRGRSPLVPFKSDVLPQEMVIKIADGLRTAQSVGAVKDVFKDVTTAMGLVPYNLAGSSRGGPCPACRQHGTSEAPGCTCPACARKDGECHCETGWDELRHQQSLEKGARGVTMPPATHSIPQDHTSGMISLTLSPDAAQELALETPGAEAPADLHITLAFLGKVAHLAAWQQDMIHYMAKVIADQTEPLEGMITGTGRFPASAASDGMEVFYAVPAVAGLSSLRDLIVNTLQTAVQLDPPTRPYIPHVTLAYIRPGSVDPVPEIAHPRLYFTALTVSMGDDRSVSYLFGGDDDDTPHGDSIEKAGGNGRWITIHGDEEGGEHGGEEEEEDHHGVHVFVGGPGAKNAWTITKGPAELIDGDVRHLSKEKRTKHPKGVEPKGARDHPTFTEKEPRKKRAGKPYARTATEPDEDESLTEEETKEGLRKARAALGAKPTTAEAKPEPPEPAKPEPPKHFEDEDQDVSTLAAKALKQGMISRADFDTFVDLAVAHPDDAATHMAALREKIKSDRLAQTYDNKMDQWWRTLTPEQRALPQWEETHAMTIHRLRARITEARVNHELHWEEAEQLRAKLDDPDGADALDQIEAQLIAKRHATDDPVNPTTVENVKNNIYNSFDAKYIQDLKQKLEQALFLGKKHEGWHSATMRGVLEAIHGWEEQGKINPYVVARKTADRGSTEHDLLRGRIIAIMQEQATGKDEKGRPSIHSPETLQAARDVLQHHVDTQIDHHAVAGYISRLRDVYAADEDTAIAQRDHFRDTSEARAQYNQATQEEIDHQLQRRVDAWHALEVADSEVPLADNATPAKALRAIEQAIKHGYLSKWRGAELRSAVTDKTHTAKQTREELAAARREYDMPWYPDAEGRSGNARFLHAIISTVKKINPGADVQTIQSLMETDRNLESVTDHIRLAQAVRGRAAYDPTLYRRVLLSALEHAVKKHALSPRFLNQYLQPVDLYERLAKHVDRAPTAQDWDDHGMDVRYAGQDRYSAMRKMYPEQWGLAPDQPPISETHQGIRAQLRFFRKKPIAERRIPVLFPADNKGRRIGAHNGPLNDMLSSLPTSTHTFLRAVGAKLSLYAAPHHEVDPEDAEYGVNQSTGDTRKQSGVAGYCDRYHAQVFGPWHGDAWTATHELGHAVDHALGSYHGDRPGYADESPDGMVIREQNGKTQKPDNGAWYYSSNAEFNRLYKQYKDEPKLRSYMRSSTYEMFADGYSMFHRDKKSAEDLRDIAPDLYRYFERLDRQIDGHVNNA